MQKTKRISNVIINNLRTPEQDAKQMIIKAESQDSSYHVSVVSDVKLDENQLEYVQAEPVVIPIIYGETFLYKVVVVTNDGRLSSETIISDNKDNQPTAPSGIALTAKSHLIEATATYSPTVTDIVRHEWIVSDTALTSAPTIDTFPTHISEGSGKLLYPGKFTVAHTTRFWVRRVDSNNNISNWYTSDATGTSNIDVIKIDVDTEILDTNNRILTTNEKIDLTNKTQLLDPSDGKLDFTNIKGTTKPVDNATDDTAANAAQATANSKTTVAIDSTTKEITIDGVKKTNVNVATVNGKTVLVNVPTGAVFTDTTYTGADFDVKDLLDTTALKATWLNSNTVAADISGLGALATKSSVDLSTTEVTNKSLANVDLAASTKLTGIATGAQVNTVNSGDNVSVFVNDVGFTDDTVANSKTKAYIQTTTPQINNASDIWIDTSDNNKMYIAAVNNSMTIGVGAWEDKSVKANAISDLDTKISANSSVTANTAKVSDVNHVSIDLPNVNNTPDVNKPVSTIQQAALDLKTAKATILADINSSIETTKINNASLQNLAESKVTGLSAKIINLDPSTGELDFSKVVGTTKPANNATANSSDTILLNRGNHTGSQIASTISDAGDLITKNEAQIDTANIVNTAGFKNSVEVSAIINTDRPDVTYKNSNTTKTDVGLGSVDDIQQISIDDSIRNLVRNGAFNTGTLDPYLTYTSIAFTIDISGTQNYASVTMPSGANTSFLCQNLFAPDLNGNDNIVLGLDIKKTSSANIKVNLLLYQSSVELTSQASLINPVASGATLIDVATTIVNADITTTFQRFTASFSHITSLAPYLLLKIETVSATGSTQGDMWFRNIHTSRGFVVPQFSEHPEDAIERRNIGQAAKIINDLFTITSGGQIQLKQDVVGTDGVTTILDASKAIANTAVTAQTGTQMTSSAYAHYTS